METVRAFLALEISDDVRSKIMEFEGELEASGADIKLVEKENLHVTMKFLGDVNEVVLEKIFAIMDDVKEERFSIRVEGVGVFPNQRMLRVVWVGIGDGGEKVTKIQRELEGQLAGLGFGRERDFVPHITVGRVRSPRNRERVIQVLEKYKGHYFGTCLVDRLVLKKSVLTLRGPVYSNLREVELR